MSLVKTIASSFAALSLLALSSACDLPRELTGPDFAMGDFEYVSPSNIQGDLDRLQDFDGTGEAGVNNEEGYFSVMATAQLPSIRDGMAMTILGYFGETPFTSLPAGSVLHFSATGDSTLLDAVDPNPGLLIDNADLDVMLCGGDSSLQDEDGNIEIGPGEEINDDEYWVDIPADEVVVEIDGTDDPNVNEVTITASTENQESGELDIVVTTFDVQL